MSSPSMIGVNCRQVLQWPRAGTTVSHDAVSDTYRAGSLEVMRRPRRLLPLR
jgi:hypothetical protein